MRIFKEEFIEQMGKALPQLEASGVSTIQPVKYSAVIQIGNWYIQLTDKTFTKRQIKNMKKYFGWEVKNLCESQSET